MVATGWNPVSTQAPCQGSLPNALASLAWMILEVMGGFLFGSLGLHKAEVHTGTKVISLLTQPRGLCQYITLYFAGFVWGSVKLSSQRGLFFRDWVMFLLQVSPFNLPHPHMSRKTVGLLAFDSMNF